MDAPCCTARNRGKTGERHLLLVDGRRRRCAPKRRWLVAAALSVLVPGRRVPASGITKAPFEAVTDVRRITTAGSMIRTIGMDGRLNQLGARFLASSAQPALTRGLMTRPKGASVSYDSGSRHALSLGLRAQRRVPGPRKASFGEYSLKHVKFTTFCPTQGWNVPKDLARFCQPGRW